MTLRKELFVDNITLEKFHDVASRYESILPPDLKNLDELRYNTVPERVAESKEDDDARLEKADLVELVRWKLSKGKFRPSLQKLVQDNAEETVIETTRSAFKEANTLTAIKKLSELRGIGPATASLIQSVFDSENVPFFSDELFLWVKYDSASGQGWDRKIKYNMKEYAELLSKIDELRARLNDEDENLVNATDIEKVAYVIAAESSTEKPQRADKRKNDDDIDEAPVSKTRKTRSKKRS